MKTTKYNLSHYKLMTGKFGYLYPVGLQPVNPGDVFDHSASAFIRMKPLNAPVMHPIQVKIHHWFVPLRIIWEDFESFITGGSDGLGDGSSMPVKDWGANEPAEGSLGDYLGIPANPSGLVLNVLPFRAYNLIFNEWYRDQQLQPEATNSLASGTDATTATNLLVSCWDKDYFTTLRPEPQLGADITIPSGGRAPVSGIGQISPYDSSAGPLTVKETNGSPGTSSFASYKGTDTQTVIRKSGEYPDIWAELGDATGMPSLLELREAFALQRYEEARNIYGSRYTEYLRYLGIRSSDARLQRPEYLGGGKQTLSISEVLATNALSDTDPSGVGQMAGHGIGAVKSNRYRRFFEEHGYVVSLMTVRPLGMYVQGVHRDWIKTTKEDFFQKELAHIGDQEVDLREIYAATANPTTVFGYGPRYEEYRRAFSGVSGEFRSSLNYWHFARSFSGDPTLDQTFIECLPTSVPFQVTTGDKLECMINHRLVARRAIPPGGIGSVR